MPESTITKKALAESLKILLKNQGFDKITVADIASGCGMNRQSFYYHFLDKYDLVNWVYSTEIISANTTELTFENWGDRMADILSIMKREQVFFQATLRSSAGDTFHQYLFKTTRGLLIDIIRKLVDGHEINYDNLSFIAEFYTFGIVGIVTQWAKNGMHESPEQLAEHLRSLVNDSKQFAVSRYFQEASEPSPPLPE